MALARVPRTERAERARELLALLGLRECADRSLSQLSGGQQQRVALATAMANRPRVLLADEPTGELDSQSRDEVFAAIRAINDTYATTVLIVTHDAGVSTQVRRTVEIRDGRTAAEVHRRTVDGVEAVAEEYAVLDRAGRMQLPKTFVTSLGMRDLVRLDLESDHIGVWPTTPDQARGGAAEERS
jgi:ABC-type methionine transport system ATPase subunit